MPAMPAMLEPIWTGSRQIRLFHPSAGNGQWPDPWQHVRIRGAWQSDCSPNPFFCRSTPKEIHLVRAVSILPPRTLDSGLGDLRRLPSAPRLGLACGALRCTSADIRRWWAWWAAVKGELCAEDIVQHYILDSRYWETILRDSCVSQASCQMSFSQAEMALFFLVTLLVDGLETQDGPGLSSSFQRQSQFSA